MNRQNWTCGCQAVNAWTARFCEGCGLERPGPKPLEATPGESPPPLVYEPPRRETVQAFMAEIRTRLGVDVVAQVAAPPKALTPGTMTRGPVTVAMSTEPICAGCGQLAAGYVLRDARLWHPGCWRQLRARIKAARRDRR